MKGEQFLRIQEEALKTKDKLVKNAFTSRCLDDIREAKYLVERLRL